MLMAAITSELNEKRELVYVLAQNTRFVAPLPNGTLQKNE